MYRVIPKDVGKFREVNPDIETRKRVPVEIWEKVHDAEAYVVMLVEKFPSPRKNKNFPKYFSTKNMGVYSNLHDYRPYC